MTEFFWEIKGEGKGEFKGKGQLNTPSAPSKKVLYLLLHSFHLREWTQLPRGSESARTPTCVTFTFKIFKTKGEKNTRSASEMMNAFLLKAVLNVLEFNQNYLFLVSFAVVSFTLVH